MDLRKEKTERWIKEAFFRLRASRPLEKGIKELVYREYPAFREDLERQVILIYTIYGGYHAYQSYQERGDTTVFRSIEKVSSAIQPLYARGWKTSGG